MNNIKKCAAAVLIFALLAVFLFSGCNPIFIKSDKLYFLNESGDSSESTSLQIKVDAYEDVMSGSLLYYDASSATGLYTQRIKEGQKTVNYLCTFDKEGSKVIFSGENAYSEGYINVSENVIYFKEYDSTAKQATMYKTDLSASKKERYTETFTEKSLIWHANKSNFYYINSENKLIKVSYGVELEQHMFDVTTVVKKISYMPSANCIFFTIIGTQKSTILYKLDLSNDEVSAVDGNIGDFICSDASGYVAYTKTVAGHDQLYLYNTKTYLRTYLTTNDIEKISLSSNGNYVAFATKITTESPSQSVWVINYRGDTPTQLTANTTVSGQIFFTSPTTLMFTLSETRAGTEETLYILKKLTFNTDYAQDPLKEDEEDK